MAISQTVEDLYHQVLGRDPDPGGLTNWQNAFGTGPLTQEQINTFKAAAEPELAITHYQPPAPINSSAYFAANPDVAEAYKANSYGMTADEFAQTHYNNYGAKENRLSDTNAIYDKLVQDAYGTIGRTGIGTAANTIDQPGFDYWKNQLASGAINPQDFGNVFGSAVNQYIAERRGRPRRNTVRRIRGWWRQHRYPAARCSAPVHNRVVPQMPPREFAPSGRNIPAHACYAENGYSGR
mgnify:CR=1 FL=1